MARRKKAQEEQMKLFEEGGLKDEGGTVDPVSGNDVPPGSTQAEVRDDIPAQLSEGEFVFPADVVRYIGLENLMELRAKAKQGLARMEQMGQMGNADEATIPDDGEYDGEIDDLIENFNPDDPSTFEFNEGGVVMAQQGTYVPPNMGQQQFSYGYMPTGGYGYPGQQQQAPQYPQYGQFISRPAQQAVGQQQGPSIEDKQYIGPNGELITIRFVNGKPQQEVPAGFKVYKPEEAVAPTAPVVTKPTTTGGDGGDQRDSSKTAIDIGNALTGKVDDEALNKAKEDLANFGLKTFALTAGAMVTAGPGAAFGIAKSREAEYNQLRDNYFKEVARVATAQNPDKYTEPGLYSRLTNPTTKVLDVAKEGTPAGFTDETRNTYVDMDGLVRDTSGLSSGAKDALETESRTPSTTPIGYDDSEDEASGRTGPSTSGPSTSGPPGGSNASGDPSEEGSTGAGGDQASADAAGGSSMSSPFSKGGLAKQTQRVLKSTRKKK